MLLSITTTHRPATDLGYLLHKNPARSHELELAFGRAHMFYPEATEERCTFALLLDVDPVGLVRGSGKDGGLLDQYVNDRPYAASSFLSVAIAKTLRTALGGRCEAAPGAGAAADPAVRAGDAAAGARRRRTSIERLFAPLGYRIAVEPLPLDVAMPDWGPSPYVTLRLEATCRLADLLNHLYVLIPVLDLKKHYYIDAEEIEKLLAKGGSLAAGASGARSHRPPLPAAQVRARQGGDRAPRRGRRHRCGSRGRGREPRPMPTASSSPPGMPPRRGWRSRCVCTSSASTASPRC